MKANTPFLSFFLLCLLALSTVTYSQNNVLQENLPDIRCGTMQHYAMQVAQDPTIEQRRLEFEQKIEKWLSENPNGLTDLAVTLPVVVHIVYNTTAQNVSDQTVFEQINVMNQDYGGLNTHTMGCFSSSLKVNTELQFCLAKRKPDGSPTNGIERRYTTESGFISNDNVKHYSSGGLDAWDPTKYINIWVCNLTDYLGYAQFPWSGINATFGLVVRCTAWGITGASAPYNLGGTATHELGHCFTLLHIWGDENACTGSDQCGDTPNQAGATWGDHSGCLHDACSTSDPGIMYMNFMDYSDDIDYANFTPNQKSRIQACFISTGYLYSLLSSNGCTPVTTNLISDAKLTMNTNPSWYLFDNSYSYWCAVGVRPDYAGEDWDIEMYSDDGFNLPVIANSSYGSSTPVDFVVMDNNHAPQQTRGIKALRYAGTHSGSIEYEGYNESLSIGLLDLIPWPTGDVVEMWDIYLTPATYKFKLTFNSGTADLGMAIFGSNGAAYYSGRSGYMALADSYGSGIEESFLVTITSSDYYGLCVFSNNANAANFNINVGIPGQWLGTISSDWNTSGNWGLGEIPTSTTNVSVSSGTPYAPVIGDGVTAYCKDLTLLSGATLTQNATSYFHVNGDLNTDAGQFTMTGSSYLYFNGALSTIWDDDNGNDTYTYVRVDKSSSTSVVDVWQNMTMTNLEIREGKMSIDGTWTVTVTGTTNYALSIEDGGSLVIADETVNVNGGISFSDGSQLSVLSGTIRCGANFYVGSNSLYNIGFTGGNLIMNGNGNQYIMDYDGGLLSLYNLEINKPAGTCFLSHDHLKVSNDLTITAGILSANNSTTPTATYNIYVGGDWSNVAGLDAFVESTGTVYFNGGNYHQYCSTETFNILNVNKPSGGAFRVNGGTITCATYDWTAGAIDVLSGYFVANALADNGISGSFYLNSGGQIDLTNTSGYVDLNGNLNIYGGTFNVHGGTTMSYWPFAGNATINMSNGILDFKDQGIRIHSTSYTLTTNISGGTIRTAGNLHGYRTDFHPTAGTFEMYGPNTSSISTVNGCDFYHLNINKETIYPLFPTPSNPYLNQLKEGDKDLNLSLSQPDGPLANDVIANSNLDVNGNFTLTSGTFVAPDTLYIGGNWTNLEGTAGFEEGTGFVFFDGNLSADINSSETFSNVILNKTYDGIEGLEFATAVTISGYLSIVDGTLELNDNAILHVEGNINIAANAGLNANDNGSIQIFCGASWSDNNTSYSTTVGFASGNFSIVTFDAPVTFAIQIIKENNPFNNIYIASEAPWVRPDLNFRVIRCKNLYINSGTLKVTGGKIDITNNLDIYGTLEMSNTADSVLVDNDILWRAGSNDNITAGKIFAGSDWTFYPGTNATLGTGNTVVLDQGSASLIRCDDPDACFGNLFIGKPASTSSDTYIHGSSSDTLRVDGDMTILGGNQFHVQSKNMIVQGNLDVQNLAELDLSTGYLLNHYSSFVLNGLLDVHDGIVLIHGTFELATTGKIEIAAGSFTSDALLVSPSWQYIRGVFKITSGTFRIKNNSINFASTAVDSIYGGTIITGEAFAATHAGTFQPWGGKVKCTYNGPYISSYIYCSNGNYFHNLEVSGHVGIQTDITVKNDVLINAGHLSTNTYDIYVSGDWTNTIGTNGFEEYTQKVVFTGTQSQHCYGETFYKLQLDKAVGDLIIPIGSVTHCEIYDWTAGEIQVSGGTFTANDLEDNGLYGKYFVDANGGLMELHQDAVQYIDLNGRIRIDAGTMNIYGGNGNSYWPFAEDAEIWMYGGTLDFKDNGIFLFQTSQTLDEDILGGVIRVAKGFTGDRSDFHPTGGTLELYGPESSYLEHGAGSSFHHLLINKLSGSSIFLNSDNAQITGNLTVEEGTFDLNWFNATVNGNVAINTGGILQVSGSSELRMTNTHNLDVNTGGNLVMSGYPTETACILASNPASSYHLNVFSGGIISAENASFKNMSLNGVNIYSGGIIDPVHPFISCTFSDGVANGTLLTVNNDQTLTIDHASFPENTWSAASNVTKAADQGHLYFTNYSGNFSGENYDADPYNRIDWLIPLSVNATALPESLCSGNQSQLAALAAGGLPPLNYHWSPEASLSDPFSQNPIATPLMTTAYSVTITDALGMNATDGITVTVFPQAVANAGTDLTIFSGNSITLNGSVAGGTPPYSYLWTPGTGLSDPTIPDPVASPLTTTTYTLSITDASGCSSLDEVTITVINTGSGMLEGTISYDNSVYTSLSQVTVFLIQSGTTITSTISDADGFYQFDNLAPGTYDVVCSSSSPWGGCNSADALLALKHFVGLSTLTGIRLKAANVDNSPSVNSIDALMIARRFTSLITSFPAGDWAFLDQVTTISAGITTILNIPGLCYGDVNGSYVPPYKNNGGLNLVEQGVFQTYPGDLIEIPVSINRNTGLGAVSLILKYPSELLKINGIDFLNKPENTLFNILPDEIRIAWYATEDYTFESGEILFYVKGKILAASASYPILLGNESELSDHQGNPIIGTDLIIPKISTQELIVWSVEMPFPNPFSDYTDLQVSCNQEISMQYQLFDAASQLIQSVAQKSYEPGTHLLRIDGEMLAAGTYTCVLEVNTQGVVEKKRFKLCIIK